jgi:hypothetical protein
VANVSAAVATAPAVEVGPARASVGRMVAVAVAYMAIVLAATIYPLVSPLRPYLDSPTPLEQAIKLTLLDVDGVTVARNLDRRRHRRLAADRELDRRFDPVPSRGARGVFGEDLNASAIRRPSALHR